MAAGAVERLESRDDRAGEQTATAQMRARAAQEGESPAEPPRSWIVCIGTMHRSKSCRLELECPRIGANDLDPQRRGALSQSAKQGRVEVKRGHAVAGAGEIERHPARPGADV